MNRPFVVWVWTLVPSLAVLVATYFLFVEPPPPRRIVIATGTRDGAYHRFGLRYAEALRAEGLVVDVRETAGSVENLRLLGDPDEDVSIAFVQSGVADADALKRFHALGSLYHEPLWIFHRTEVRVKRLGELAGQRIGIGPVGSGTHTVALRLLAANGLIDTSSTGGGSRVRLVEQDVAASAESLRKGELDVAFFVAAFDAEYIRELLNDREIVVMSCPQQEAYHRRFRFLAPVDIPKGLVNLGENVPAHDVALLAPTAMLVVRKDFHPALVPLLLMAANRIHGAGDELSEPGEFPSASYCDFPMSEDARRFYESGQPVLQRLLPFWLASLVDRVKVMLIPLVMLMMPLIRAAPPLMRWRTRRKIYLWYSDLREIDRRLLDDPNAADLDRELEHLGVIDRQVAHIDVPLSYMEEVYHLRLHLGMMRQRLIEWRARCDAEE